MASKSDDGSAMSISLPSALKPARVVLTQPSFGANGEHGQQQMSATQQFYGSATSTSSNRATPSRTRTSFGPATSVYGTKEAARLQPPSILPPSTFLHPKKPSMTLKNDYTLPFRRADRQSQDTSDGHSRSNEFNDRPSMYLSDYSDKPDTVSDNDHSPIPSGQLLDVENGTQRRESIGHDRTVSRHGTITSRTSREPLILSQPMGKDQNSSVLQRARKASSESKRRTGSKTGSIGSLLGFKSGESTQSSSSVLGVKKASSPIIGGRVGMSPHHEREEEKMPNSSAPEVKSRNNGFAHVAIPVVSEKSRRPLRNYEIYRSVQSASRRVQESSPLTKEKVSHEAKMGYQSPLTGGNNRFYCAGRLISSGESPYPFLASFAVIVLLPGVFLAFESQWLWRSSSPSSSSIGSIGNMGGRALVILFAYSTLIMWSSMLRTALRDPGVIVKGLDREPDWELFAVPVGGVDDMTGTGMGQKVKMRMVNVRNETIGSKCRYIDS